MLQSGTEFEDPVATKVRGQYLEKSIKTIPTVLEDQQASKVKEAVKNNQEKTCLPPPPYKPPIPYSQRSEKSKIGGQFEKKSSCFRLDIVERNVDNTPSKRAPPDILQAHPESNIFQDNKPLSVSKKKKKKGKRKTPMKWFDMFKWRPKDVGHKFKNVSMEEAPY